MAFPMFTGFQPTMTVNDNRYSVIWTVNSGGTTALSDNTIPTPWLNANNAITTDTLFYRPQLAINTLGNAYTTYIDNGPTVITLQRTYTDNAVTTAEFQWITTSLGYAVPVPKTAAEKLKDILDQRIAPNVLSSCKPLGYTKDERELRARETLRRVLGDQKFKDFLRRGSISVKAKSGLMYQIFPGHDFTKVYNCGKLVDRLCVVLQGGFPPTDSLIMRYLMILNNEQQFRSFAVKHGVDVPVLPVKPDQRTLVEIFKELKAAA